MVESEAGAHSAPHEEVYDPIGSKKRYTRMRSGENGIQIP